MHHQLHHETPAQSTSNNDISGQSECTSKAMKELEPSVSRVGVIESIRENKETFSCHLCSMDSDRITVLDRHLLNDHKIGLENLLKLVMSKTKDGLSEECPAQMYGIRQPYYRPPDDIIEDGEFVIETITPKIKILKHTSTNTDLKMSDIPDLSNCQKITKEIEKLIDVPSESSDKNELLEKMQNLNECMCKFVDSTNTIKKVLTKEYDQKNAGNRSNDAPYFNLGLGE
ncbi:jg17095 [Pararge aegeria aegeria]|uniref:Jg17095 protein n=1 Tax=Pararge aegeria aegeria TaxID=348720 RepID=A0A8S4R5J6_9NEOP|nr:jg17095 [Pararge aegeria aegeria]